MAEASNWARMLLEKAIPSMRHPRDLTWVAPLLDRVREEERAACEAIARRLDVNIPIVSPGERVAARTIADVIAERRRDEQPNRKGDA